MRAEYIDHMGSDARVVDAARVSFSKSSTSYSTEQNIRLIHYLAKHNHFTPFTHPQITLRETVPIFVARQRLKHVVGFTYNEVSRRYVDEAPEFHEIDAWRARPACSVKQGSAGDITDRDQLDASYRRVLEIAEQAYRELIEAGVAPEQARAVLQQSLMTSYDVTGSLAAWARFYNQRTDPHAQAEIQELARQVGEIIAPLFPVSWAALTGSQK